MSGLPPEDNETSTLASVRRRSRRAQTYACPVDRRTSMTNGPHNTKAGLEPASSVQRRRVSAIGFEVSDGDRRRSSAFNDKSIAVTGQRRPTICVSDMKSREALASRFLPHVPEHVVASSTSSSSSSSSSSLSSNSSRNSCISKRECGTSATPETAQGKQSRSASMLGVWRPTKATLLREEASTPLRCNLRRLDRRRSSVMGFEASDAHRRSSCLNVGGRVAGARRGSVTGSLMESRFKTDATANMMTQYSHKCLRDIHLFQRCETEFVEVLMEYVTTQLFEAGTVILREGDHGTDMYMLAFGKVEVSVAAGKAAASSSTPASRLNSPSGLAVPDTLLKDASGNADGDVHGNRIVVANLETGAIFGEMASFGAALRSGQQNAGSTGSHRRCATVKALTFCDCRVLQREGLMCALRSFPANRPILAKEAKQRGVELEQLSAFGSTDVNSSVLGASVPTCVPLSRKSLPANSSDKIQAAKAAWAARKMHSADPTIFSMTKSLPAPQSQEPSVIADTDNIGIRLASNISDASGNNWAQQSDACVDLEEHLNTPPVQSNVVLSTVNNDGSQDVCESHTGSEASDVEHTDMASVEKRQQSHEPPELSGLNLHHDHRSNYPINCCVEIDGECDESDAEYHSPTQEKARQAHAVEVVLPTLLDQSRGRRDASVKSVSVRGVGHDHKLIDEHRYCPDLPTTIAGLKRQLVTSTSKVGLLGPRSLVHNPRAPWVSKIKTWRSSRRSATRARFGYQAFACSLAIASGSRAWRDGTMPTTSAKRQTLMSRANASSSEAAARAEKVRPPLPAACRSHSTSGRLAGQRVGQSQGCRQQSSSSVTYSIEAIVAALNMLPLGACTRHTQSCEDDEHQRSPS